MIKSIEILKKRLILSNNLNDLIRAKNLVLYFCASILTKDYATALEKTQDAIEVLAQTNVNSTEKSTVLKLSCKHRLLSLQKLERTDEVQKILLKKQEEKISKLKAQGRFVKQLIKYSQKNAVW